MKIAILGGTGNEGFGLGFRWAAAGHQIILGSRLAEKGVAAAAEMARRLPESQVSGFDNISAALAADLVVLAVPYEAQAATLQTVRDALKGKLLITVVAPLDPARKARAYRLPGGLSAAEQAQAQLGDATRVVAAFQNISAHHLADLEHALDCDVLICGEKAEDKEVVIGLAADAGMRGVNAGPLANATVVEGLTAVLLGINVRHKIRDAGIRITGLPKAPSG
jgi:NADPH-dependent F420 reductase